MGQYHEIYNLDKKEMLTPHRFDDGGKLWGFKNVLTALAMLTSNSNGRGGGDIVVYDQDNKVIVHPLSGSWAADRIVIQGDYAKKGDKSYISEEKQKDFKDISAKVMNFLIQAGVETTDYFKKKYNA